MSLNFYLQKIIDGNSLSESEAAGACEILLQQESSSAPAGALLTAMHMRGETQDEIVGFAQNLRKQIDPIALDVSPLTEITSAAPGAVSAITLGASLLVASAGGKVAKLLNRSSQLREIDLLPQLGINSVFSADETRRQLQTMGIGFINITQNFARLRSIRAHQEALGVSQLLDCILPLAHPAQISSLLLGLERPQSVTAVAQALRRLRFDRGFVIASINGKCPFSAPGNMVAAELKNGRISNDEYSAADFGLNIPADLASASLATQVGWLKAFSDNRPSPITDAIRWTSMCAMVTAGRAESLPEALKLTDEAIKANKVSSLLSRLETSTPYTQMAG